MDQKKRASKVGIVTAVILLLAAAAVAAVIFLRPQSTPQSGGQQYLNQTIASVDSATPLMQSDIDNVFYAMATDGTVTFYEYDGQEIKQIELTGTVDIAPMCSGVQIPATIYYIQRGDEITGYGLYNPPETGNAVYIYTYFFFNMRALPDGYPKEDNTQFLLLMDSEKEDLYVQDKTYDESFFVQPFEEDINLRTDPEHNQFVSQVNRMPGTDGRYWTDFAVFTEDVLAGAADGNTLFFSGRHYMSDSDNRIDLYRRYGSSAAVRRTIYTDVANLYAYEDANGGIHYMKQTDGGFAVYCNDEMIKEFSGDYATGYLRHGNYLLDKARATVTDLLTGEEMAISGADTADASLFRVNPDGEQCIIGITKDENGQDQTMIFADFAAGESASVSGAHLFSVGNTALDFIDADAYYHNTPASGGGYTGRVFSFDAVTAQLSAAAEESEGI